MESSDIMITLNPSTAGRIDIQLESSVEKQFGNQIRRVIEETLKELGVTSAEVIAVDKGGFRLHNSSSYSDSVHRAAEVENYDWKEIDSWNA